MATWCARRPPERRAGSSRRYVAAHASACLAGADLPEEEAELTAALLRQGWSESAVARNDTFAVLRAGVRAAGGAERPWGVAVTCGAGINCVAVAPDGGTARYLALGTLTGDWGGGAGLSRHVMWHSTRAEDGRGPATALSTAVAKHFGLPSATDVAIAVHKGRLSDDDLLRLTSVLFAVAAAGDPVARDLVTRQADEVCLMAVTAMRRLGLPSAGAPVVLGGGLLEAQDAGLLGAIERRLAVDAPGAVPRVVDVPPVAGAALLGLDHVGPARRLSNGYATDTARPSPGNELSLSGRRSRSLRRDFASALVPRIPATSPPMRSATTTGATRLNLAAGQRIIRIM